MASFRVDVFVRGWPPIGLVAMLVLGWTVGIGPTTVDDWFTRLADELVGTHQGWLLFVTDRRVLGPVLGTAVAVALCRRQWRLAVVALVSPGLAIALTEGFKRLFERHKGAALAYPSGHMTLVVVVMGIVVVVAGYRLWAITIAIAASLLAIFGLASTYHYLTDTIGAALSTTAVLCVSALAAGRAAARNAGAT